MNFWIERMSFQSGKAPREFNSNTSDGQFQRDRARAIHSSAFRRLQSKTQVLTIGESDFYRTRLTHSLEVAQIGSGICESLREKYADNEDFLKWIPSLSLIEAICLFHDIGHPPFGHGGEVALNYFMADKGGFEGNGQTLRIVSKLGEYSTNNGLDLTRRTILGIMKYPSLYSDVRRLKYPEKNRKALNIDGWKPPKCIHDDEKEVMDWVVSPFCGEDRNRFTSFSKPEDERHGRSIHKSFDTTIMELADDIAYGVHDLEDALALQLVSRKSWVSEVADLICAMDDNAIKSEMGFYNDKLFSDSNKERKHAISKLVGFLIPKIKIYEETGFDSPLLRLQTTMESPAKEILQILKDYVYEHVIKRPEVQILEYKGQYMVMKLFEVLSENPKRLLPASTAQKYVISPDKDRVICDYMSGMTDSYASKLYHKLFSPDAGSIFDRL